MGQFLERKYVVPLNVIENDLTTKKTMNFTDKETTIHLLTKLGHTLNNEQPDDITKGYRCGTKRVVVYTTIVDSYDQNTPIKILFGRRSLIHRLRDTPLIVEIENA